MTAPFHIRLETAADRTAVDALIERAFGPGRYAKAAERLREGNSARADLSLTGWMGGVLAGAVRLWPIRIGDAPALLLGPIVVAPEHRGHGLSAALTQDACRRATEAGDGLVLLVGEARLFEPLGFQQVEAGRVRLPGPVDPRRVFVRALRPDAFDGVGGDVDAALPAP